MNTMRDAAGRQKRRGNYRPMQGQQVSIETFEAPLDAWQTHYLTTNGFPMRDALNRLYVGTAEYLREMVWRAGGTVVAE